MPAPQNINLQLKGNSFQGLASTFHNLLSCEGRTSETDLIDVWVRGDPWTEVVITAQDLDNSRWEELLSKLDQLNVAIWRERTESR